MYRWFGILMMLLLAACGTQEVTSPPRERIADVAPDLPALSADDRGPLLYIYRPWRFADAIDFEYNFDLDPDDDDYRVAVGSRYGVRVNGRMATNIGNGQRRIHAIAPGRVLIEAVNLPSNSIAFVAEEDAIYFIRVTPAFQAGPYVQLVDYARASEEIRTLGQRPPWAILVPD